MRLSSDVLYDNLKSTMKIEVFGPRIQKPTLTRPVFHEGPQFAANSVSVANASQFLSGPRFEKNCLIICVGGTPPAEYLFGQCSCFVLREQEDILKVFNELQQIFNKYDDWQYRLLKNVDTKADLQELVDTAFPIFRNPMTIIDANFHLHAYSSIINYMEELAGYRPDSRGNLKQEILGMQILNGQKMELNKKEPFIHVAPNSGTVHLCRNLFIKDVYIGNLTVPFILDQMSDGDFEMFRYFSKEVERAVSSHATVLKGNSSMMRNVLMNLLQGQPLNIAEKDYLRKVEKEFDRKCICLVIRLGEKSNRSVPIKYICNVFENTFPYSIAIEYNDSIVAMLDTKKFHVSNDTLPELIRDFLKSMDLTAAGSCIFSEYSQFKSYYRQACLAFDYARVMGSKNIYHRFEDYKLTYMTSHCFGEFPVDIMYTAGFRNLLEIDAVGQNNYIETLRVFLNNSMNATKTAEDLFIHRSTLLERIKKIEKYLNLKDSDHRLYLQIMLKAMEFKEKISGSTDSQNAFADEIEEE